jgi:transcriptional regulator with XRE-family HTH domain
MAQTTAGARRLKEILEAGDTTRAQLAKELGITPQAITVWLAGRVPLAKHIVRIEELHHIPFTDWLLPVDDGDQGAA